VVLPKTRLSNGLSQEQSRRPRRSCPLVVYLSHRLELAADGVPAGVRGPGCRVSGGSSTATDPSPSTRSTPAWALSQLGNGQRTRQGAGPCRGGDLQVRASAPSRVLRPFSPGHPPAGDQISCRAKLGSGGRCRGTVGTCGWVPGRGLCCAFGARDGDACHGRRVVSVRGDQYGWSPDHAGRGLRAGQR
jgi:hypothetical protein